MNILLEHRLAEAWQNMKRSHHYHVAPADIRRSMEILPPYFLYRYLDLNANVFIKAYVRPGGTQWCLVCEGPCTTHGKQLPTVEVNVHKDWNPHLDIQQDFVVAGVYLDELIEIGFELKAPPDETTVMSLLRKSGIIEIPGQSKLAPRRASPGFGHGSGASVIG